MAKTVWMSTSMIRMRTRIEVMDFSPKEKPCCHPYSAEHPR